MITRRSTFLGLSGVLFTPAIVHATALMKLPRRQELGIYHPYLPLIVTRVAAKSHKLKATWTLEASDILSLNDSVDWDRMVDEITLHEVFLR